MSYFFVSLGTFIGSAWDITHNHGYWITATARTVVKILGSVGLA
jgi:hypothetical protein